MFRGHIIGHVRVKGVIANPFRRDLRVEVEFIADTGAIYTMIPEYIAERLDLKVVDKRKFRIASGEVVEYPVSEAYIIVEDKGVTSLVVIGSEKTLPLLGVTTLELLGFQVDPITGRLKPLELLLL
jgi:clan AA aspartic protease